jgi:hypothetical protein
LFVFALKFTVLLPQIDKCCNYRKMLPNLAKKKKRKKKSNPLLVQQGSLTLGIGKQMLMRGCGA